MEADMAVIMAVASVREVRAAGSSVILNREDGDRRNGKNDRGDGRNGEGSGKRERKSGTMAVVEASQKDSLILD
jgi:hypothetical protein